MGGGGGVGTGLESCRSSTGLKMKGMKVVQCVREEWGFPFRHTNELLEAMSVQDR